MTDFGVAAGVPGSAAECHFVASDADSLCRQFMAAVSSRGTRRVFDDEPIHELWGLSGVLENPRARLFTSSVHPEVFNPALALARWLYLFSGSDRLADIVAYSPAAARFTDDGVTMPGGSHGSRAFYPASGVDQVEGAVARIAELGETTQSVIAFHHPTDLARQTQDYICVTSMLLTLRDDRLHCMLHMRSNEAFQLLWYDLFEFTMLGEYVAARLGVELGAYLHSGFVFQITGDRARERAAEVAEEVEASPAMARMPPMTIRDRAAVVDLERQVRESARHAPLAKFVALAAALPEQVDPYWADVLGGAALQARFVATPAGERARLLEEMAGVLIGPLGARCLAYSAALGAR